MHLPACVRCAPVAPSCRSSGATSCRASAPASSGDGRCAAPRAAGLAASAAELVGGAAAAAARVALPERLGFGVRVRARVRVRVRVAG